ncbi:gp53-like domain-containing protein, partial [Ralstonia mannitolilytica]|uniref:gp53-like domain-containing protein n=1 Tax=Ralstonia mannitolilytica TaxID=105219 RepID=UPI0029308B03
MDRQIIYSGQVPQTTDLLNTNKQTMIGLAKLCSDLFGTATLVSGLGCVPTSPASMSVNINPGQIYQLVNVDGTAYSAIAADTTHSIMKQGILLDAQSFALTAPGTVGYSQNYLIQATYLDNDINNTVLPYYNSANPSQAFNGPGGNGTSQPTTRAGQVSLQLVAGTAAATGTQTTPAVTTGYVGIAVITVANGQSTITAGNISAYPNLVNAPMGGFLAAMGERFSSIQTVTASTTLTTAALGALVNVTATGQTVTLPPAANCPNGTSICVTYMQASGSTTVARNGTDTLAFGQGSSTTSITLNPGEEVQFVSNGTNGWVSAGQTLSTGVTPPQFDNSVKLATTAFVRQFGSSFAGVTALAGNNTIPASNAGQLMVVGGGGSSTQTLPAANSVAPGSRLGFKALPSNVTIARSGTDTITVNGGSTVTSITLNGGDTLSLVSDGVSNWQTYDGSAQLPFAAVMSGANWQSPPQFDNSTRLMTSAAVRAVGLQFGNEVVLSGSTTLDVTHAGKVVVLNHAGVASTYTLPSAATYPPGATITLFSVASATGTIQRAGSDTISVNNGATVTSLTMGGGDSLVLESYSGGWRAIGGSAQLGFSSSFFALLAANGYQKLPSGLIVQWGSVSSSASADVTATFPIALPNACRAISLAANSSAAAIPVYNTLTSSA